ncbi:MAG: hypothetical protein PVF83_09225 [Anaerolineales bacterium]|jgi:hypothetical protein
MDKKTIKQMAKMVDPVQEHCDETIIAAMTCNHAGSMSSLLLSKFAGGIGGIAHTSNLPNPVFIAVGDTNIYAFDYAPKGFKFKIKKEVARWPKSGVQVEAERGRAMTNFVIAADSGEHYSLEIPTMMGGKKLVDMFLEALGVPQEG